MKTLTSQRLRANLVNLHSICRLIKKTGKIINAESNRDAVCCCARYVAKKVIGMDVDEVEEKAGLLHHHYPCLASMEKLVDFNHDTLMHESAHLLVDSIHEQIKPYKKERYLRPGNLSEK